MNCQFHDSYPFTKRRENYTKVVHQLLNRCEMSECDYDNKQSGSKDEQCDNMLVLDWLRDVQKGQEAQMNILKYLLKRDGQLFDGGKPCFCDRRTREVSLNLGHILDQQRLTENALELSNYQSHDLSTSRKFEASKARNSCPVVGTAKVKPPEVKKSKSSSYAVNLTPVQEEAKSDVHLSPRIVPLLQRRFDIDQKEWIKQTERMGEESVYYVSSNNLNQVKTQPSDDESSDSVKEVVSKNGLGGMSTFSEASSRGSTPPGWAGHRKPIKQRFGDMQWEGKQDLLSDLTVSRHYSHSRVKLKLISVKRTDSI